MTSTTVDGVFEAGHATTVRRDAGRDAFLLLRIAFTVGRLPLTYDPPLRRR